VLEDTGIKMKAVASKTLGMLGRAMLDALIACEPDAEVLADLAKGQLRERIDDLVRAFHGEAGVPSHRDAAPAPRPRRLPD
jgi:transposase